MPPLLAVLVYVVVMMVLAVMVKWECGRRRKGPKLNPAELQQRIGPPPIAYTAPRDRARRSIDVRFAVKRH
jgi:hypothetical protein